ncbi:hypothetical protein GQR58_024610 [Nymphon striatum]|nr:hypothetical protein GQR58_024610 [Nymphon striatum]
MVNLNLTLRAYKGHLTRSAKELEKIATFVEINPSPRGLSELETSFKKYTTSLEKVESTIEEIIISEELEEQRINEYNTEIQGYYSKLDELRQKLLTINKNITLATKPAQPFPTTATPVKPRICDALKPFQLNDKHTPADLRNWIGKFNVYHSSSSMERYSTVEQHMFLFSCLNFSLETKVRENDSYNPELHIFGDYGVVQILQEEFDLCFPLFNRRLDFFRYRQTPGQKFTDFMIHLKQKGEEADLHSLDIDSLYVFRYITGITDSNLRERFLKLTNPNLDQLKKETRAYEIGKHAAKAMDDLDVTTVSKICDRKGTRYTKPFGFHSNKVPFQSKFPIEMKGRCWTCGSKQHDTTNCPKDKNSLTCFHCNKKGHLSTICISKFKSKSSSGDVAVVKAHLRTHSPETDEETDDDEQVNTIYCRGTKTIPNTTANDLELDFFSKSARSCEEYKQLISALKEGKLPQNLPHNHLAKSYSKIWNDLSLYEDDKHTLVLLSGHRIVVPRDIRSEILRMFHLPHQGLVKTKQLARQCYYWPGINASITNLIDGCLTCLEFQPSQSHEPLLESTIPYVPMTHVGVDLFDALGKSYVVMVDRFSGFLFVSKITNSSTSTVTKILLKWFCDFGYPDVIRSDGGPCFRSEFSEICNQYFIKHELSSAYNPSSNGLAEAAVKNAKILLQKCKETGENFEQALSEFRLMPRADGFSPANLMFNRSPRGLLPSMRNSAAVDHIAGRKARQKTLDASHSYQSSRPTLPCLKVGDAVLLQDMKTGRWSRKGTIISIRNSSIARSYEIECDGKQYIRNRRLIRPHP